MSKYYTQNNVISIRQIISETGFQDDSCNIIDDEEFEPEIYDFVPGEPDLAELDDMENEDLIAELFLDTVEDEYGFQELTQEEKEKEDL
jgi:hypothetical protein